MIGIVWGLTFKDGFKEMENVERDYEYCQIGVIDKLKTKTSYVVKFENGDVWRVCGAIESNRGFRVNVSYIDHRIDKEFINTVIKPATKLHPYHAYKYF